MTNSKNIGARDWLGFTPTPLQVSAFVAVGTIALLFAGLQPILLGALVEEHRLTASALGEAATIEFFTLGLGVGVVGAFSAPTHLRLKGGLAACLLIAANLLVLHERGLAILVDRAVAGLAEGVIVWLTASLISRSAKPARWAGIFLVSQGVAQFALAALLPMTVMKHWRADGGFAVLAVASLLALGVMFALPNSLPALEADHRHGSGVYSTASIWSLISVFLIFAFFIGLFAYFEQFAAQAHLNAEQSGVAVSLAVGLSIFGSGAAAALARRVTYFATALICLPINLVVLGVFASHPSVGVFIGVAALFGFFWGFFMPLQVSLVIEVDPTRRTSLLVPGIQGVGAAAGPLLCSFFVTETDASGALAAMAACLLLSFVIGAALHFGRARRSAAAAPQHGSV
jgi:hypothetical protein